MLNTNTLKIQFTAVTLAVSLFHTRVIRVYRVLDSANKAKEESETELTENKKLERVEFEGQVEQSQCVAKANLQAE